MDEINLQQVLERSPSDSAFLELLDQVALTHPSLSEKTLKLDKDWSTGDRRDAELTEMVARRIQACVAAGMFPLQGMLDAFSEFSQDFFERQMEFMRTGEYRAKDYSEVVKAVYADDRYMQAIYYPALVFCYLGSPNYRHILRAVDKAISGWRELGIHRVLDFAGGHGFLLLHALEQLPQAVGVGLDLSPSAGRFAKAMQKTSKQSEGRFDFRVQDLLAGDDSGLTVFDAAFCCELLEHLPDPELALRALHAQIRAGGRLFITAAIRMESVDHLTLFKNTAEVCTLLRTCGFEVVDDSSVPFVLKRPSSPERWARLMNDPMVPATFVAECIRR